jgi:hypothetical protein
MRNKKRNKIVFRFLSCIWQQAGTGNRARRPHPAALHRSFRFARIGHIAPELDEDLRDTEQVGINAVADKARSRPVTYAARAEVS